MPYSHLSRSLLSRSGYSRRLVLLASLSLLTACEDNRPDTNSSASACDNQFNRAQAVTRGFEDFSRSGDLSLSLFTDVLAGLKPDVNARNNPAETAAITSDLARLLRDFAGASGGSDFAPERVRNPLDLIIQQLNNDDIDNFKLGREQMQTCALAGKASAYNNTRISFFENTDTGSDLIWNFTLDMRHMPNNQQVTETFLGSNTNTSALVTYQPASTYRSTGYNQPTAILASMRDADKKRLLELIKRWPDRKDTLNISSETAFTLGSHTDLHCVQAIIDYRQQVTLRATTTTKDCGKPELAPLIEYASHAVPARQ